MPPLDPLVFRPLFKSMLWGGFRLRPMFGEAAGTDPTGEAWVLSDVPGSESVVANGPLAGRTLRELIAADPAAVFGDHPPPDGRFPLLLKFIDARQELSVQVHPNDEQAVQLEGAGKRGKTEAWVVVESDAATSRLYAGFRPGVTAGAFADAVQAGTAAELLHRFPPEPGDCLFLEAGTVHAIGANLLIFEVQQTSDITYRLYDWDRKDPKTGRGRELHIEKGMQCSDFARGACDPVVPQSEGTREQLVNCPYFTLHRTHTERAGMVGVPGRCSAVVCVNGRGRIGDTPVSAGTTVLLPAAVGAVKATPDGEWTLLECGMGGGA
ncbi:MAG: class I mannose-6-phosphate isomerase [Fimbriiglobus sp.]|jgi:mannose-6-phosphate isomerase|nr:class I mannose-6-phosphate isomerase [Fimbriiglobus sp.]